IIWISCLILSREHKKITFLKFTIIFRNSADLTVFRNSALLKTRTYLGLLTPCLALHGSQRLYEYELSTECCTSDDGGRNASI
ncbi:hypothetical protein, partial [Piscirickettsia salmonis]|uniref:hypothetical protein n=1 Tax=Piscirickettsia salmonis TaxID=1238 RepID=UPI001C54DF07